ALPHAASKSPGSFGPTIDRGRIFLYLPVLHDFSRRAAPVRPACQDGPVTLTAAADILTGLDPEQREAVEAVRGPVCILAGAGTGKTRAITHRIAFAVSTGVVAPPHVLAVTFTARAAGELRGRLRSLGAGTVQARTFHSAALR